jgi:hypothetical protein
MTTLVTTRNEVYQIQEDVVNSTWILFSDAYGIQALEGTRVTILVGGSNTRGYIEGVGEAARFNNIYSFLQWNMSTIFIADYDNDCIRVVDRGMWRTSSFAGNCTSDGFIDSDDALFDRPYGIIKDPYSDDKLIVTDTYNDAIRQLDINTRMTITLVDGSNNRPYKIVFDAVTDAFFLGDQHSISRYNYNTNVITVISGSRSEGFSDGDLAQAKFFIHPT